MMASPLSAAFAALFALLFFGAAGLPVAHRLFEDRAFALAVAPTLGWALFSAASLPVLCLIGFGAASVTALGVAALAASAALGLRDRGPRASAAISGSPGLTVVAHGLAAALAAAIAFTLLPKWSADGVLLAGPIFDHSKVAIVDEIVRNGVPAQNPFYGGPEGPSGLAYYYLWHFSAAMLALLPGVSGWEADVGLTWFTTFSMITLMMGLAVRASGRPAAALWVPVLCLAASARWLLDGRFGQSAVKAWLAAQPVFSFVAQIVWAPQHGAGAACLIVCALLIDRLSRRADWPTAICLGLTAAAGFGASVWVGGLVFATVAVAVGALSLARSGERVAFLTKAVAAAAVMIVAAFPILLEQIRAAAARTEGVPVAFRPQDVLGPAFGDWARGPFDILAYWLIELPYDLPAIYPAGALFLALAASRRDTRDEGRRFAWVCALVAIGSFAIAGSVASTILNNDIGWRAALPGILVVTAYAAAGVSGWSLRPIRAAAVAQMVLLAVGLGGGVAFARQWMTPFPSTSAAAFADSPELWSAVRLHAGPTDRVANNPLAFAGVTPWPVNISWALLADRRSCYAAWEFARPFAPISLDEANALQKRFTEAFAGGASADEAYRLFASHGCHLVILTANDGAWNADPFARDGRFQLAEERPGKWRLYKMTE